MEIEKAKELKQILIDDIQRLIWDFETETGLSVNDINITKTSDYTGNPIIIKKTMSLDISL